MVQLGATLLRQDASLVQLEGHLISFDGHGHRLLRHRLKRCRPSRWSRAPPGSGGVGGGAGFRWPEFGASKAVKAVK